MTDLRKLLDEASRNNVNNMTMCPSSGGFVRTTYSPTEATLRLQDMAPQLAAALLKAEEALAFYADPETYRSHPHGLAFESRDKSYVAAAALAEIKALKGGENG